MRFQAATANCHRQADIPRWASSNAALVTSMTEAPEVSVARMLDWTAAWTRAGGSQLGKPTHFGARDGKF